ncbi:hypothetical protein FCM35_KLT21742 [Carex littledalei]|uniref:proteasome endopeptidase complex n=1 Tax=Carex littledalei TaxID=544730 RepID=A0A833QCE2_9POAL|nr:hypothetical protein FCM35_KLT21742 [Carex littledalei]
MVKTTDLPTKGGFSFDLCRRNEMLLKNGVQMPPFRKTGTTIVGLVFQDGVVLGADTRATEGPIVADKNCEKIHFMSPNIYCCGAGTAADTEAVTDMVSSQLQLHRYATGRESRVVTALTLLKSHLFNYQGHVSAALVLGGVDVTGPHLHTVYPHGSTDTLPFATMGSGLTFTYAWDMQASNKQANEIAGMYWTLTGAKLREEGIELVAEAICAGIFNDLGSGSNVDVCVITKGKTEYLRNYQLPNPRTYISSKGYTFVKGQTDLSSDYPLSRQRSCAVLDALLSPLSSPLLSRQRSISHHRSLYSLRFALSPLLSSQLPADHVLFPARDGSDGDTRRRRKRKLPVDGSDGDEVLDHLDDEEDSGGVTLQVRPSRSRFNFDFRPQFS